MIPLTVSPDVTRETVLEDLLEQLRRLHTELQSAAPARWPKRNNLGELPANGGVSGMGHIANEPCLGVAALPRKGRRASFAQSSICPELVSAGF